MTAEDIGSLYPTKIPAYTNNADIKAALRLYHYGSETYDPTNTDPDDIPSTSIAGKLKSIENDINALEASGTGSEISSTQPSTPVNGYIWVDSTTPGTEKTAYIYNSGTWYKMSGEVDVSADYTWTGTNSFTDKITSGSDIIAKVGINNFLNLTARDAEITSPTNGTIAFIRQDNSGNVINQLQYYYNGWTTIFTNPVMSGSIKIDGGTIEKVAYQNVDFPSTYSVDLASQGIVYFEGPALSNSSIDIRWNSSTSLNSKLSIGESTTTVVLFSNGSNAYYITQVSIDGSVVTPKWSGGTAPTGGNVNAVDAYTFVIIKTAANTFTVLGSLSKFA